MSICTQALGIFQAYGGVCGCPKYWGSPVGSARIIMAPIVDGQSPREYFPSVRGTSTNEWLENHSASTSRLPTPFGHLPPAEIGSPSTPFLPSTPGPVTSSSTPPQETCFFWYHGHCVRGARCIRAHEVRYSWPITAPPRYIHRAPCYLPLCPLRHDLVDLTERLEENARNRERSDTLSTAYTPSSSGSPEPCIDQEGLEIFSISSGTANEPEDPKAEVISVSSGVDDEANEDSAELGRDPNESYPAYEDDDTFYDAYENAYDNGFDEYVEETDGDSDKSYSVCEGDDDFDNDYEDENDGRFDEYFDGLHSDTYETYFNYEAGDGVYNELVEYVNETNGGSYEPSSLVQPASTQYTISLSNISNKHASLPAPYPESVIEVPSGSENEAAQSKGSCSKAAFPSSSVPNGHASTLVPYPESVIEISSGSENDAANSNSSCNKTAIPVIDLSSGVDGDLDDTVIDMSSGADDEYDNAVIDISSGVENEHGDVVIHMSSSAEAEQFDAPNQTDRDLKNDATKADITQACKRAFTADDNDENNKRARTSESPIYSPPRVPKPLRQTTVPVCFYWYHKGYCCTKRRNGRYPVCRFLHTLKLANPKVSHPPNIRHHGDCGLELCPVRAEYLNRFSLDYGKDNMDTAGIKQEHLSPTRDLDTFNQAPQQSSLMAPIGAPTAPRALRDAEQTTLHQAWGITERDSEKQAARRKRHDVLRRKKYQARAARQEVCEAAAKALRAKAQTAVQQPTAPRGSDGRKLGGKVKGMYFARISRERKRAVRARARAQATSPSPLVFIKEEDDDVDAQLRLWGVPEMCSLSGPQVESVLPVQCGPQVRVLVDYDLPEGEDRAEWDTDYLRRVFGEIA